MSTSPFFGNGIGEHRVSVVVADDVVEIQNLVGQWLQDIGFAVTCVSSGREAVRHLRSNAAELVITDILMPDGDGLEVIAELRRIRSPARILAMSGGGSHLSARHCLKIAQGLGAHGLLWKPLERERLVDAVGFVLAGQGFPAVA